MKYITDIFEKIIKYLKTNKKIAIFMLIVILGLIGIVAFKNIKDSVIEKIPIETIEVTCDYEFSVNKKLVNNLECFNVTAIRKGDKRSSLDPSKLTFSQEYVNPYGEYTTVEAIYHLDDETEFRCNVDIPNERKKIVGFQCGYPSVSDVVAVLYSNGELAFEGTGDTLVFYEDEYPWIKEWWEEVGIEEEDATVIRAVTFQENVKPTNLNYAFKGLEELVYIDEIPSSVRTMVKTFAECKSLKNAADVTDALVLINMNHTYEGCEELVNSNVIPENVRVAKGTFKGCTKLQIGADMTNANNLIIINEMYSNCWELASATLNEGIIRMDNTFEECINLKQVFNFPTTVTSMKETFKGCVSLIKFDAVIPESVTTLEGCFENCELLSGEIYIFCDVEFFDRMFEGACQATKVNLVGNSMLLDAYANTNDMENIYVNGYKPNKNVMQYLDVFEESE